MEFSGSGAPLSAAGIAAALAVMEVGAPEIWSVIGVETSGCGFLPDRRPKILFERHVFSRLTGRRFDADDPDISQPTPGGYGLGGAHQYLRLTAAMQLDAAAALGSASWGLGQILGENFAAARYGRVEDMVTAMVASEDGQLAAMANFIKSNGLDRPLQDHDWARFARLYNGPDYAAHNYDGLLENFYARYSNGALPDLRVRAAQIYLTYHGYAPGTVDGIAGPQTIAAVKAFQAAAGVAPTGAIDDALMAALGAG